MMRYIQKKEIEQYLSSGIGKSHCGEQYGTKTLLNKWKQT